MAESKAVALQHSDLNTYMAEVHRHPVLTREEEFRLAKRYYDAGDVAAAHALVVSNLRFVVKIAHEYKGYGFHLLDLIQEGNIGLMTAVKRFNPNKGYRLVSYAVWWIRAYIQNFVMRSWSVVRLGSTRNERKLFFKLKAERKRLERANPHASHDDITQELAHVLNVDDDVINDMEARLAAHDFSLDAQMGDTPNAPTHLEHVIDAADNSPEQLTAQHEEQLQLHGKVAEAMNSLNDKERYIVEHRMLADEPQTLQEIGETFQVSRERIRQLESRVITKLKERFAQSE